jgi:hypothetical protein
MHGSEHGHDRHDHHAEYLTQGQSTTTRAEGKSLAPPETGNPNSLIVREMSAKASARKRIMEWLGRRRGQRDQET